MPNKYVNDRMEEWLKEREEREKKYHEAWIKECKERGINIYDTKDTPKPYYDHPNTMENSTATVLWIVVMGVGSIFKGNFVIWIIATIAWWKFITRHKNRK